MDPIDYASRQWSHKGQRESVFPQVSGRGRRRELTKLLNPAPPFFRWDSPIVQSKSNMSPRCTTTLPVHIMVKKIRPLPSSSPPQSAVGLVVIHFHPRKDACRLKCPDLGSQYSPYLLACFNLAAKRCCPGRKERLLVPYQAVWGVTFTVFSFLVGNFVH